MARERDRKTFTLSKTIIVWLEEHSEKTKIPMSQIIENCMFEKSSSLAVTGSVI